MNRALIAAFSVGLLAVQGCSRSAPSVQGAMPQTAPEWTLKQASTCEGAKEDCVSGYGFTVTADGSYVSGPNAQGKLDKGQLSADELQALKGLVTDALGGRALPTESVVDSPMDANDTITFSQGSTAATQVIRLADGKLSFRASSGVKAQQLHDALSDLAQKYYPYPFDACASAALDVEAQYGALQTCTKDEECTYVNRNYTAVAPSYDGYLVVQSRTVLEPLAVANRAKVLDAQVKLSAARDAAEATCQAIGRSLYQDKSRGVTQGTLEPVGIYATAAPVCKQNVCRVNPSLLSSR